MREKLIELLDKVHHTDMGKTYQERICSIVDYLIANGVTIPVRCKECQCWIHIGDGIGDCTNGRFHLDDCPDPTMMAEEFCCLGKRRTDGKSL